MAKKDNSKQIEAMKKAGFTDEEIAEMLEDDDIIEHTDIGESGLDWELSKEEHKKAVKYANVDEKKKPEKKEPKPRKENPEKRDIINLLYDALLGRGYAPVIDNPERIVKFAVSEQNYSITLTAHRKPKN